MQLGVNGTCKVEAGQHLRTSVVRGRRQPWEGCALSAAGWGHGPASAACLSVLWGRAGEPAHPRALRAAQPWRAPQHPSVPHQRLEVTARASEASCKSAKVKARPVAAACGGPAPPDAWQLSCHLLLGTPAQAIGGRRFAEMPRAPYLWRSHHCPSRKSSRQDGTQRGNRLVSLQGIGTSTKKGL